MATLAFPSAAAAAAVCARPSSSCCNFYSSKSTFPSTISPGRTRLWSTPVKNVKPPRMVVVGAVRFPLKQLELGAAAPDFELVEPLTGKLWTLKDFEKYPALLVIFTANHCPFVIHLRPTIVKLTNEYIEKGLGVVAISPNSVITHPQDGPDEMAEEAKKYGYQFPYLYDETQEVTKAYGPLGTPDFFVFKKDENKPFELAYHGQFDDARPHDEAMPVTGRDLRAALNCVLSGEPINTEQEPSMGCTIKWHPGTKF